MATLVDARLGGAARRDHRIGPRRRLPVQGHRCRITVGGTEVSSPDATTRTSAEFEIGLDPFEDGGWVWFDITTDTKTTVHEAGWYAPVPAPGRASVVVGIPTFNRPADCVNALAALTSDPLVDNVITGVIVSDQGTQKAKDHPGFDAAAAALGSRLSIHNQPTWAVRAVTAG